MSAPPTAHFALFAKIVIFTRRLFFCNIPNCHGTLNAYGNGTAAANRPCGGITIDGATVYAYADYTLNGVAGTYGAGIGGAWKANFCDSIEIVSNSTVVARGGVGGAGIGSSCEGGHESYYMKPVKIEDSNVTATGGLYAAGIGGPCGWISIGGKGELGGFDIRATGGGGGACAIGAGDNANPVDVVVNKYLSDSGEQSGSTRLIKTWNGDLSKLTGDVTAWSTIVITGTMSGKHKITLVEDALVTLKDAVINGDDSGNEGFAGLTCAGNATIQCRGTNIVKGFGKYHPGIYVPQGSTATIYAYDKASLTAGSSETDEYGNVWHYRLVGDGNGGYGAELYRGANTPAVEPAEDEYWLLVPDTLGGYPVIGAGEYAFFRCDELQSVDLPLTATCVKANAFAHCGALMYVNMEGVTEIGDYAFYGCANIDMLLPENLASIGEYAFHGCRVLGPVEFTAGFESLGMFAFEGCTNITEVAIPGSLSAIPAGAFYGCTSLKTLTVGNLTAVGSGAFAATALETVYVPVGATASTRQLLSGAGVAVAGVTFIEPVRPDSDGDDNKTWYYRLVNGEVEIFNDYYVAVDPVPGFSIDVPETIDGLAVKRIGAQAFQECLDAYVAWIYDGVESIGNYAFSSCIALETVQIPASVAEIGDNAFYNTPELANVWISAGTKNRIKGMLLASGMDQTRVDGLNFVIRGEETAGNYRLSYTVSNGEATIDGCEAIDQDGDADLVIPSTVDAADGGYPVTRIQDGAFDSVGLTSVTIPEGVAEIGPGAFMNNSGLTEVTLPSTLVYIGGDAFDSCDSLQTINVPAGSAAAIAELLEESGFDLDIAGVDIVEHEVDPYAAWAVAHGVAGARNEKGADGIENVFRYIFGMTDFSTTPLIDIAVDGANVVIRTPPVANSTGYSIAVKSSANVDGTGDVASTPLAAGGTTVIPKPSSGVRFYRLAVERSE